MAGIPVQVRSVLALLVAAWVAGCIDEGVDRSREGSSTGPFGVPIHAVPSLARVTLEHPATASSFLTFEAATDPHACPSPDESMRWACEPATFEAPSCVARIPAETFEVTRAVFEPALCTVVLRPPARQVIVASLEDGDVIVRSAAGATLFDGTDHVATLNAALASLCDGGGVLELGPGVYRRTGRAALNVVCDDVAVLGRPGATLDQQAPTSDSLLRVSSYGPSSKAVRGPQIKNVTIAGLTLVQTVESGDAITVAGTENAVVLFNRVIRSGEEAIAVYNSNGTVVLANRIEAGGTVDDGKTLTASLQCLGCSRFVFAGNVVDNQGAARNTSAIQISHGQTWAPSRSGLLAGNVVRNSTSTGVHIAQGSREIALEDPVVSGSGRSCLRIDNQVGRERTGSIRVRGGFFEGCARAGLEIIADDVEIDGAVVAGTGGDCLRQYRQERLVVTGVSLEECGGHAISAVRSTRLSVKASHLEGSVFTRKALEIHVSGDTAMRPSPESVVSLEPSNPGVESSPFPTSNPVVGLVQGLGVRLQGTIHAWLTEGAIEGARPLVLENLLRIATPR